MIPQTLDQHELGWETRAYGQHTMYPSSKNSGKNKDNIYTKNFHNFFVMKKTLMKVYGNKSNIIRLYISVLQHEK